MNEALWKLRAGHVQKFIEFEAPRSITAHAAAGMLECYCGGRLRLLLWLLRRWIGQFWAWASARYEVRRAGGPDKAFEDLMRKMDRK